jgi:hypothetical protein
MKFLAGFILLLLGIFIDVIIGIILNVIFLNFSTLVPLWLIISIVVLLDAATLIGFWGRIVSFFNSI